MDDLITLSCPSCGAALQVSPETQQFSCEYCGNSHFMSDLTSDELFFELQNKRNLAHGRLMDFFDFKLEDIKYNREGKLSPYQERRFFVEGLTTFLLFIVAVLMVALGIIVVARVNDPCMFLTVSILAAMILGLINYKIQMRSVEMGVVKSKVGTLGKPSSYSIWWPTFYIGEQSFAAKGNPFTVLEWNVPYKVYYLPGKRIVLSIEIMKS